MAYYKYHPMQFLEEEYGLKISARTGKFPNFDLGIVYQNYIKFVNAVRSFLDRQAAEKRRGTWHAKSMSKGARKFYETARKARNVIIRTRPGLYDTFAEPFMDHVLDEMRGAREASFLSSKRVIDTFLHMDTPQHIAKYGHLGVDRIEDANVQQTCKENLARFRHLWKHRVEINQNMRIDRRNMTVAKNLKFKIPKAPFGRMTRNTVETLNGAEGRTAFAQRMTRDALEMLQIYVEHSLVKNLKCVDMVARHGKVKTVSNKHVNVLRAVQSALGASSGI